MCKASVHLLDQRLSWVSHLPGVLLHNTDKSTGEVTTHERTKVSTQVCNFAYYMMIMMMMMMVMVMMVMMMMMMF